MKEYHIVVQTWGTLFIEAESEEEALEKAKNTTYNDYLYDDLNPELEDMEIVDCNEI